MFDEYKNVYFTDVPVYAWDVDNKKVTFDPEDCDTYTINTLCVFKLKDDLKNIYDVFEKYKNYNIVLMIHKEANFGCGSPYRCCFDLTNPAIVIRINVLDSDGQCILTKKGD